MQIFDNFASFVRKKFNRNPNDIQNNTRSPIDQNNTRSPIDQNNTRSPIGIHYQYPYPEDADNPYTTILTDDVNFKNPVKPGGGEFDFQKYSDAIVSIINGSDPKFSIGIYGEWGSGKTTLMRMIEKKLNPEKFEWEDFAKDLDSIKEYLKSNFQLEKRKRNESKMILG